MLPSFPLAGSLVWLCVAVFYAEAKVWRLSSMSEGLICGPFFVPPVTFFTARSAALLPKTPEWDGSQ